MNHRKGNCFLVNPSLPHYIVRKVDFYTEFSQEDCYAMRTLKKSKMTLKEVTNQDKTLTLKLWDIET